MFTYTVKKVMMKRLAIVILVLAIGSVVVLAFRPVPVDEHEQMLTRLDMIRQQMEASHRIFGRDRLSEALQALDALPADAAPGRYLILHLMIGEEFLRSGDSKPAVEHFEKAFELVRDNDQIPTHVHNLLRYNLAVACLRQGENENCIECSNGQSCIFPIRGRGIHTNRTGSQKAIQHMEEILAGESDNLKARWLLNIAYMTLGEYPAGVPPEFYIPLPEEASIGTSATYKNIAADRGLTGVTNAGGVIIDDFDGDEDLDIVASTWNPAGQLNFYRNDAGTHFVDDTQAANLRGLVGGLNLIQADYDNDGDIDILVLRGAWFGDTGLNPNSLLQNDGHARFRDVTKSSGLDLKNYPTQTAAWADYDNDGDLDLYIGNERCPNQLFQNNGDGTFTDKAQQAGVDDAEAFCKGVVWGDFDGDRFPDIYVSNYGTPTSSEEQSISGNLFATDAGMPNRLYRNNRDGTFTNVAAKLHVEKPYESFPAWFWDFNNDGALDLFVSSYSGDINDFVADYIGKPHASEPCCLYLANGEGGFSEVSKEYGLSRVSLTMGANFGDLDNDGFLDFYLGTGAPAYDYLTPNVMYRNNGGRRFDDITTAGGFGHLQKGHGIAFADIDNDGQQEVFAQLGGAYPGDLAPNALFSRQKPTENHWLKVNCRGVQSNRFGVGVRICARFTEDGKKREVYRWVSSGGSFGANPLQQQIGVGSANSIDELEIYWPTSDTTQKFNDVACDQILRITEGETGYQKLKVVR